MSFPKLDTRSRTIDSHLCVGLDPRPMGPIETEYQRSNEARRALDAMLRLIDVTLPFAASYKPNIAFFEQLGPKGMETLEYLVAAIPNDVPIILDAKRGDIGATSAAYAEAALGQLKVDSVTLSPYMGKDVVEPFLQYPDAYLFSLVRTSNPGGTEFQTLDLDDATMVYEAAAAMAASWSERIGFVVGASEEEALQGLRRDFADRWFLVPGIGAQGGSMEEAVYNGVAEDGYGIAAVVVRSIMNAEDPGKAAEDFRDQGRRARDRATGEGRAKGPGKSQTSPLGLGKSDRWLQDQFIRGLFEQDCFQIGSFTLKDGRQSPFYIDLRRIVSSPQLLKLSAKAYGLLADGLSFDRIAGIPTAGLPLGTAASLEMSVPLVYPRMSAKAHGTGKRVEGGHQEGETVLLLDDLITRGTSKIEALELLQADGLKVTDLVVLVVRGTRAEQEMADAGVKLHSFVRVQDIFEYGLRSGRLDQKQYDSMVEFVKE